MVDVQPSPVVPSTPLLDNHGLGRRGWTSGQDVRKVATKEPAFVCMQQIGDTPHHAIPEERKDEKRAAHSNPQGEIPPTTWTLLQPSTWKAHTHAPVIKSFLSKFSCPHGTHWQSPRSHSSPDDRLPYASRRTNSYKASFSHW